MNVAKLAKAWLVTVVAAGAILSCLGSVAGEPGDPSAMGAASTDATTDSQDHGACTSCWGHDASARDARMADATARDASVGDARDAGLLVRDGSSPLDAGAHDARQQAEATVEAGSIDARHESTAADAPARDACVDAAGDGGCGQIMCSGVSVDVQTDTFNCGACGNVCSDGPSPACGGGLCNYTLATGQNEAFFIVVDATSVYWTITGGGVIKVPIGGGTPTTLTSQEAFGLALDAANVYWTGEYSGNVMKVPLGGGTPVTLVPVDAVPLRGGAGGSAAAALFLAVDATSVYWIGQRPNSVLTAPLAGGTPTTLASPQGEPEGIAVDGTSVYWTSGPNVMSVPLGGGTPTTLATGQYTPGPIAVDAESVYWGSYSGSVVKMSLAGGTPVTLASGLGDLMGMAIDSTSVYWTNLAAGTVMKVPLSGGTPTTLASGQNMPWFVAVDSTSIYWTDSTVESVMKASK